MTKHVTSVVSEYQHISQVLPVKDPASKPITWDGNIRPCDITDVPTETVNAPTAIPIIANFTADKSLLETNLESTNATNDDAMREPANTPHSPIVIMPARVAAIKIVAPPPIPNKFGSPNVLRVESCIKAPASPRQAPATKLTAILGNLMVQTMVSEIPLLSDRTRLPKISFKLRLLGPTNKPTANRIAARIIRQQYLNP